MAMLQQFPGSGRNGDSHDGEGDLAAAKVGNLDMTNGVDRGTLRRWGTTQEQKGRYLKALDFALGLAIQKQDQRAIASCVRTLATVEGQNQSDELARIKQTGVDVNIQIGLQFNGLPEGDDGDVRIVD